MDEEHSSNPHLMAYTVQVAKCLTKLTGEPWIPEPYWTHSTRLTLPRTGMSLSIYVERIYADTSAEQLMTRKASVSVSNYPSAPNGSRYDPGQYLPRVGIGLGKAPDRFALDIARRLLPDAYVHWQKALDSAAVEAERSAKFETARARIVIAGNGRVSNGDERVYGYQPSFTAQINYYGDELSRLELHYIPISLAEKILQMVNEDYNQRRNNEPVER